MSDEYSDKEQSRILKRVHKWGVAFSKSPSFAQLSDEQKSESEAVVMFFAELMYAYIGLRPEEWDEHGVDECCLEIFPRKISAEESFFRAVAPVLAAFFAFCGEKGWLANGPQLARAVERIGPRIVRAANNPRKWGIAKQFLMSALRAGVDVENEDEMNAFMMLYNLRLMQDYPGPAPAGPPQPRISRNAPCPCGSGKKYKLCCGKDQPRFGK